MKKVKIRQQSREEEVEGTPEAQEVLMTHKEVVTLLNISTGHLWRLVKAGTIVGVTPPGKEHVRGAHKRYTMSSVHKFLMAQSEYNNRYVQPPEK